MLTLTNVPDPHEDRLRDLKIGRLFEIDWWSKIKSVSPNDATLKMLSQSLIENTDRVLSSITVMPVLFAIAGETERKRLLVKTRRQELGNATDDRLDTLTTDLFTGEWVDTNISLAITEVTNLAHGMPYIHNCLIESMFNQVVAAWTAYEVLATDVWVTAVNSRPKSLGRLAWLASQQKGNRPASDGYSISESADKHFDINLMNEYGYNLSSSMGIMMKRKRHFGFNGLNDISEAYKGAFRIESADGRKSGSIPEVARWFSGQDYEQLCVLEAIRHVTVHRGGRADATFLKRMEKHKLFGGLDENTLVPINGEIVHDCFRGAVHSAIALINGVDEWLSKNPE